MTSERSGTKAKSGGGAGTAKRSPKPKKGSLRDLDAKNAKAVRGGTTNTVGETWKYFRPAGGG
jgi:hypothetical protein